MAAMMDEWLLVLLSDVSSDKLVQINLHSRDCVCEYFNSQKYGATFMRSLKRMACLGGSNDEPEIGAFGMTDVAVRMRVL